MRYLRSGARGPLVWFVGAVVLLAVGGAVIGAVQQDDNTDLTASTETTRVDSLAVSPELVEKVRGVVLGSLEKQLPERATVYRTTRGQAEKAASGAIVDSPDRQVSLVVVESPSPMALRLRKGPRGSDTLTGTIFSFTVRADTLKILDYGIGDRLAAEIDPSWASAEIDLTKRTSDSPEIAEG